MVEKKVDQMVVKLVVEKVRHSAGWKAVSSAGLLVFWKDGYLVDSWEQNLADKLVALLGHA